MTDVLYLEDLTIGQTFTSASETLSEQELLEFAARYDPQPFHLDHEAAKPTIFGGLAASGWHTAAFSMRLNVTSGPKFAAGIIGGGGELTWPAPTRPNDTLHVEYQILDIVPSRSKPDRGMVILECKTVNQNGQTVQLAKMKLIVPRRGSGVSGVG